MNITPVFGINDFTTQQHFFYANKLSMHVNKHSFIEKPHKHNHYLIVVFTKGSGSHEVDFTSYKIRKGSVFVLSPGQTHSWHLSDNIEGYIFFHSAEFYNLAYTAKNITHYPFYSSWQNHPEIVVPHKSSDEMSSLSERIFKTSQLPDNQFKFDLLLTLIDLLYLDLSVFYEPMYIADTNQSHLYRQKTGELNSLINKLYTRIKSPAEYAEMMNVTPRHLNRIVHETLGKTTTGLIAERIILEAKRMLVHSAKATKEIADELGFDDASYFIRFFKKHAGETPAVFQKRYLH